MPQNPNITSSQKPSSGSVAVWAGGEDCAFAPDPIEHKRILGKKWYELSNHLGNVLTVISDRKIAVDDGSGGLAYYRADIVNATDYYPFGSEMPGRGHAGTGYRYGFNGMEKDNEVKGSGNSYTTMFRQYDPRIGRWLSIDPVDKPWESSYAAFANNPIYFSDPFGLDNEPPKNPKQNEKYTHTSKNGDKWEYSCDEKEGWVGTGGEFDLEEVEIVDKRIYKTKPEQLDISIIEDSKHKVNLLEPDFSINQTPQDRVLIPASILNSAEVVVEGFIKNGYWLGKNSAGVLTLYGSNFYGNQYVVKTDVHIVNLKTKIKVGGHIISAFIMTKQGFDYYNSKTEKDKEAALNELYKTGAVWLVSAVSAEAALIMSIGEVVLQQEEAQRIIDQHLLKTSNNQYNRYNYNARRAYYRRNPISIPDCTIGPAR